MREPAIGAVHDRQTESDPLASQDLAILLRELGERASAEPQRSWVADLGCGTGRTFAPLTAAGWSVLGIDLSLPMLQAALERTKAGQQADQSEPDHARTTSHRSYPGREIGQSSDVVLVQMSLTDLAGIAPESLEAAACLYSTYGMIRGQANRRQMLQETARLVRPEGLLILHAHNLWNQRRFPGGWQWIGWSLLGWLAGRTEFGDRWANASGVSGLFIHSFRWQRLMDELRGGGWEPLRFWPAGTGTESGAGLPRGKAIGEITRSERQNAAGWTVVARRMPRGLPDKAG